MDNKYIINEYKHIKNIIDTGIFPDKTSVYQVVRYLTIYYFLNDIDNISPIRYAVRENEKIREENKNKSKDDKEETIKFKDSAKINLISSVCSIMKKFNLSIKEYEEYKFIPKIEKLYKGFLKANYDVGLRDFDTIDIYQSEIEIISNYSNIDKAKEKKMRKLLFTLYVMAKFEMRKGWVNTSTTELFKLANVTASSVEKEKMIGELIKEGFVKDLKSIEKLAIGITLKNDYSKEDKAVISIDDISNLGNKYFAYTDKNYIVCEKCGKLVKIKSKNDGSTKYCKKCFDDIRKEKRVEYNAKYYKLSKF